MTDTKDSQTTDSPKQEQIIIDLYRTNRVKEYSKAELFQQKAFEQCVEKLRSSKEAFGLVNDLDISDCRIHDCIFISGERGSGKSTFLHNIKTYWRAGNKESKSYSFLPVIDPTLLSVKEDVLEVILGALVNHIETETSNSNNAGSDDLKKFYTLLNQVAEALPHLKKDNSSTYNGLESILSKQSSLALEQKLHLLFKVSCQLLGVATLVLRIDDIDMSFEHGFEVLETIRKFLATPHLIPVVTGNTDLYHLLVENQFADRSQSPFFTIQDLDDGVYARDGFCKNEFTERNKSILGEKPDLDFAKNGMIRKSNWKYRITELTERYLSKVFPADRRVHLDNILDILNSSSKSVTVNVNKIKDDTSRDSQDLKYQKIEEFENRIINYGMGHSRNWQKLFMNNTRQLTQLLIMRRDFYTTNFAAINEGKPTRELYFSSIDAFSPFLKHVLRRSIVFSHIQNCQWASLEPESYQRRVLEGNFFNPRKSRYLKIHPEVITTGYFVVKDQLVKAFVTKNETSSKATSSGLNEKSNFLINLFIHDDYYTSGTTRNWLVVGKFIKYIFCSLDSTFKDYHLDLCKERPLLAAIPENQFIIGDTSGEVSDGSVSPYFSGFDPSTIYFRDIENWREDSGEQVFFNTNFLHKVINKLYSNLNVFKERTRNTINLLDYMQCNAIMLVNAIAFFESKQSTISESNIALVGNVKNLKSSLPFNRNIKPLLDKGNDYAPLTNAICKHPIIKDLLGELIGDKTSEAEEKASDDLLEIRHIKVGNKSTK